MTTNTVPHRPSGDHHHGTSMDDTFSFLNTIELESGSIREHFSTFDDAARWLIDRGVVHATREPNRLVPDGLDGDAALARVRAVREALREIAHAVADERPADPAALAEVNRAIQARERVELVPEPDGVSIGHSHVGDPLDDALARLADPLVDEIRAGNADRVRICANDTCRWIFYDESRAGRRRWCDMATCGNRAKAARHRARVKAAETDAGRAS
ncbi:MAG TPA: CGNR zinc finger domain-containing protein [Candidatus Binatia bacterium]|nr:CGNR zinc finger domain-containing protein [Candidatus Binatia bacterium]